jgi:Fe2+ or Zn2+ uptake regulation protein
VRTLPQNLEPPKRTQIWLWADEFARFELAEDLTEHHHHLLCTSCGRVIDVIPTPVFERTVNRVVEELAAQQGFHPTSHALDVVGKCSKCDEE